MNLPIGNEASSAALSEGQGISLPPLGEGKGWGPLGLFGVLLYTLIILLFCIPFVVNLVLVRRLRKEASIAEEEKEAGIRILTGEGVQAPFSFHRTIFLPANLTETQRRMILAHEQAHILHRHYVDVWVAEAITRLLWWNPFLWWARQELRNVHEFEADSNVLATGEDVYAYQAILIEEVLHGDIVIANGFNHSFIRRRFVEMLQSTNRRMTSLAKAGTAAWMLLVVALMCCTVGEAETVYIRPLPSLPQGEGVDSHAISEQQGITLPSPIKEQQEEAVPADSGQWYQAKAIGPQEYVTQVLSQLSEEHARMLLQLFSTMNSIEEITTEQYEALEKAYPPGALPSLDSINSNVREIKKSLNTLMLEGMTGMQAGLRKRLTDMLQEQGLDTLTPTPRERKTSPRVSFSKRGDAQDAHYRMSEYEELAKTNVTAKRHYSTLMVENGEGGPQSEQSPKVVSPKAHMQNGHLPTAPFTYGEYQQLTPKYHLVRFAQETHLICYECPKSDKEIINLHRGMYLTDTATGDKYMLRRVEGIADEVQSVEVNNYREVPLQVTYVFPPLGSKVKEVTLNFPHKENQTHKVKSLERASIKTIRDKSLQAVCAYPVEKSDKPDNSAPTLRRPKAADYDVQNEHTFPVYTDVYTTYQQVFHNDKDHYRIYRGKGCTYVTVAYKVRWEWEFFNFSDDMMLVDPKTGDRYMIAGVEHFPLDTHFWVNGQQGEYIRFVLVFPALPEKVTTVDLFEGGMQRRDNTDGARRYQGLTVRSEYTSPDKEKQGRVIY